jgi:hypothetical protein
MNNYTAIFGSTQSFLERQGAKVTFQKAPCATQAELEAFEGSVGLQLPIEFAAFSREFADGVFFAWEKGDANGGISIPSLEFLQEQTLRFQSNVRDFADDPTSMDKCVEPGYRQAAFEIWNRMKFWIPLPGDDEGDTFCLDTQSGRVVYNQHDWYDGFGSIAKTNGLTAGQDFGEFLRNWSAVSFQEPRSLWWGEFGELGSVTWATDRFNEEFCQSSS